MGNLPAFTPRDRLLLLAPHPDDEALAAGGLLQRAAQARASVRVIFLTDGDKNPWPQRVIERRWRSDGRMARARWGALRRREALASLLALGHGPEAAEFWSLPDQGLTQLLLSPSAELIAKLHAAMAGWQPTWLATPAACDRHPDHSAVGVASAIALRERSRAGELVPRVLAYVVHGSKGGDASPHFGLLLRDGELETKRRAILCHRSQTLLSRGRFLAHARTEEIFRPEATAQQTGDEHPLRWARRDAAGWQVKVKSGIVAWMLARREVHVLVATGKGELWHQLLALPVWNKACALRLPPTLFDPPGTSVFVKLKAGIWLYDRAGWLELGSGTPAQIPGEAGCASEALLVAPGSGSG